MRWLGLIIVLMIPLILNLIYCRLDVEYREIYIMKPLDAVFVVLSSAIYGIAAFIMIEDTQYFLNSCILAGYLIYMAYTDQKTSLLYSSISVLMILIEAVFIVVNIGNVLSANYLIAVILVPLVLSIMSKFRFIGFGDVLIYIVVCMFYIQYRVFPIIGILTGILITNIMFSAVNIIKNIINKKNDKHSPLTIYIAISVCVCNLLLI